MDTPDFDAHTRAWKQRFWLAIAAYLLVLTAAVFWLNAQAAPPAWAGGVAVLACLAPLAYALVSAPVAAERHDGIERMLLHRSTSVAFFVLMVSLVTLGLIEVLTPREPISAWWSYGLGGIAWAAAHKRLASRLAG